MSADPPTSTCPIVVTQSASLPTSLSKHIADGSFHHLSEHDDEDLARLRLDAYGRLFRLISDIPTTDFLGVSAEWKRILERVHPPKEYVRVIEASLEVRREVREAKKVVKFWKKKAEEAGFFGDEEEDSEEEWEENAVDDFLDRLKNGEYPERTRKEAVVDDNAKVKEAIEFERKALRNLEKRCPIVLPPEFDVYTQQQQRTHFLPDVVQSQHADVFSAQQHRSSPEPEEDRSYTVSDGWSLFTILEEDEPAEVTVTDPVVVPVIRPSRLPSPVKMSLAAPSSTSSTSASPSLIPKPKLFRPTPTAVASLLNLATHQVSELKPKSQMIKRVFGTVRNE